MQVRFKAKIRAIWQHVTSNTYAIDHLTRIEKIVDNVSEPDENIVNHIKDWVADISHMIESVLQTTFLL